MNVNIHKPRPVEDRFLTATWTHDEIDQLDSELTEVLTALPSPTLEALAEAVRGYRNHVVVKW